MTKKAKKKQKTRKWTNRLHGGLADLYTPSDFDPRALKQGIKVELEHTNDRHLATEIAMDHLVEDPDYYTKLATIEKHSQKATKAQAKRSAKKSKGTSDLVRRAMR